MIEVLLVSPRLAPTDPRFGGDHGYTQTLLAHPPPGVRYLHYEDLITTRKGCRLEKIQALVYHLGQWGIIAPGLWFESFQTNIRPDLVHIISFTGLVRVPKNPKRIPVVIGTSTGSSADLRHYYNWPDDRVRRARAFQRRVVQLVGAYETSLNPRDASRVHVWSNFAKGLHLKEGYCPSNRLDVLPPAIPLRENAAGTNRLGPVRFLFVGRDFERKNGPLVMDAFRRVRAVQQDIELIIVGQPRDGVDFSGDGIVHHQFVQREELLTGVMPSADVLILPSKAEGFGLVLLEAMGSGLAVIGVNAFAMPEIIDHDRNGFLIEPDSLDDLVACMHRYAAEPNLLLNHKEQGRAVLSERFSIEKHNARLLSIYQEAIAGVRA